MKDLDRNEFHQRLEAIAKARKIFIPHITKNITIAFDLYQELLAEEKMANRLVSKTHGNRPRTILDEFERLECEKCGAPLRLRVFYPKGEETATYTRWECEKCPWKGEKVKKTVEEWIQMLKPRKLRGKRARRLSKREREQEFGGVKWGRKKP